MSEPDHAARYGDPMSIPQPEPMPYNPQEPHVDLSTLEALREAQFRYALAVKQLGPGGLVITPEDRRKPAPMIHDLSRDGIERYVTYTNGS